MKTFSLREKVAVRPDEGDVAARFVRRLRNAATQATSANDPLPSFVPRHPHLPCGHPLPAGEEFCWEPLICFVVRAKSSKCRWSVIASTTDAELHGPVGGRAGRQPDAEVRKLWRVLLYLVPLFRALPHLCDNVLPQFGGRIAVRCHRQ